VDVNLTAPSLGVVNDPFNVTFFINNTANTTLTFLGNLTLSDDLNTTDATDLNFTLDPTTTSYNQTWNVTATSYGSGTIWVNLTANGTSELGFERRMSLTQLNVSATYDPPQYANHNAVINVTTMSLNGYFSYANLVHNVTITGDDNSTVLNATDVTVHANQTYNSSIEWDTTDFSTGTYNVTIQLLLDVTELATNTFSMTLVLKPGIYIDHFGYGVNDTFSHVYPISGGLYSADANDTLAWSFYFADSQGGYIYWNQTTVDHVRVYECNNSNGTDCSINYNFTTTGTRYNTTAGYDLHYFDDRFFRDEENFTTPMNESKTYLLRVNASYSSTSYQTDVQFNVTDALNTTAELNITDSTIPNSTMNVTVPFNYTVNGTLTNATSSTFVRLLLRRDDDNETCNKWLYGDRTCVTNNETNESWNCTVEDKLTEVDNGTFEFFVELPNCTQVSGYNLDLHLLLDDAGRKAAMDNETISVT
jgi:hypothetical protein